MRARLSGEIKLPETVNEPVIETFPGMEIDPDESIVKRATPLETNAMAAGEGLMIPVLALLANFKAQLVKEPGDNPLFTPS
jgi:hypothetical protein